MRTKRDLDLGVGIIAFENVEFLKDICSRMREAGVKYLAVYVQDKSYDLQSEIPSKVKPYLEKLKEESFIDSWSILDPAVNCDYQNGWNESTAREVNKRNMARLLLWEQGCSRVLIIDSDELYEPEDIRESVKWCEEHPEIEATYCTGYHYYKDFTHIISNPEVGFNFICKASVPFKFKKFVVNPKLTYEIDFMRQLDTESIYEFKKPMCHHFAFVRSSLSNKIVNAPQKDKVSTELKVEEYARFGKTSPYVD